MLPGPIRGRDEAEDEMSPNLMRTP
jgi:hypothetical protein